MAAATPQLRGRRSEVGGQTLTSEPYTQCGCAGRLGRPSNSKPLVPAPSGWPASDLRPLTSDLQTRPDVFRRIAIDLRRASYRRRLRHVVGIIARHPLRL